MYERKVVGLKEAEGAGQAMLKFVREHPDKFIQQAAVAIVDEQGHLVYYAKMDSNTPISPAMAIKKAYTCVIFRKSTMELLEWAKGKFINPDTGTIADLQANVGQRHYEHDFTAVGGGVPILLPGQEKERYQTVIGAIGVGGAGPAALDHEVAMVGLKYIQDTLWPSK